MCKRVQGSGGKEEESGALPSWLCCETQDGGIVLLGTRSGSSDSMSVVRASIPVPGKGRGRWPPPGGC